MNRELKAKIKDTIIIFTLAILTLEVLLRILGVNKTSEEITLDYYNYKYKINRPTWFHTWLPNTSIEYGNGEFLFHNKYNELGHREKTFEEFKQDTTSIKIVCLGDSYTEGDGAPYDSTWVRFLEEKLERKLDTNVNAYNAGVCGSDVIFNGIMLKEKLLASNPSIVFECVNNSDILDLYYRGGKERFSSDGSLVSPKVKKWEPIYKYSYLFRAFFLMFSSYDNNLINTKTKAQEDQVALHLIAEQLKETALLCKQNQIEYHVILMPVPTEMIYKNEEVFDSLLYLLPTELSVLNIKPLMTTRFDSLKIEDYYWKENGHYNGNGYLIMSEAILTEYYNSKSADNLNLVNPHN